MIRPMEAEDLTNLDLNSFGKSIRAVVAEVGGKAVAVAGVIHTSPPYAFANLTPAMRDHPRDIMRVIKSFDAFLQQHYEVVYAVADPEENNAPRVLRKIGFEYYMTTIQGDIYRWQQQPYH